MSKLIFHTNDLNFSGIATDADWTAIGSTITGVTAVDVSDEDFNAVRNFTKQPSWDGATVTYEDLNIVYPTQTDLELYITNKKAALEQYQKDSASDGSTSWWKKDECAAYITVLENFDASTVTYPHTGSIEKHWDDTGVTWISGLQII